MKDIEEPGPSAPAHHSSGSNVEGGEEGFWNSLRLFASFEAGSGATVLVFLAAAAAITALIQLPGTNLFHDAPLQVVLGGVAFLFSVLAIVAVFGRLGLSNKSNPLALPPGSVRALIALVLLIIFVIFGNVIFGITAGPGTSKQFSGLTPTQVETLPGQVIQQSAAAGPDKKPGTADDVLSGTFARELSSDAVALGGQIVTALITLVTAISAFYFGSGSVDTATRAIKRRQGGKTLFVLRPGSPSELSRDATGTLLPVPIELAGTAIDQGSAVAVVDRDPTGRVVASLTDPKRFTYTPGSPNETITLTFRATEDATLMAQLVLHVPAESGPAEGQTDGTPPGAQPPDRPSPEGPLTPDPQPSAQATPEEAGPGSPSAAVPENVTADVGTWAGVDSILRDQAEFVPEAAVATPDPITLTVPFLGGTATVHYERQAVKASDPDRQAKQEVSVQPGEDALSADAAGLIEPARAKKDSPPQPETPEKH